MHLEGGWETVECEELGQQDEAVIRRRGAKLTRTPWWPAAVPARGWDEAGWV